LAQNTRGKNPEIKFQKIKICDSGSVFLGRELRGKKAGRKNTWEKEEYLGTRNQI
jgi:hypothetical protein